MSTLQEKIKNTKLTKKERQVADYLLSNKSEACFMTATDIAHVLSVSDSSIVRFSRTLGFTGFNGLKRYLQNEVSELVQESVTQSLMTPSERLSRQISLPTRHCVFEQVLDKSIKDMKDVLLYNSHESIDATLDILQNSRNIYILGFRTSATVAQVLGYQLNIMLENVITNTNADARAIESLVNLGPEDCVVLISFPRHGKMARLVHAMALDKKAKVIAITDKATSPIASSSDVALIANITGVSYFNSMLAATFLAEALCTALSQKDSCRAQCRERLELINQYIAPDEFF